MSTLVVVKILRFRVCEKKRKYPLKGRREESVDAGHRGFCCICQSVGFLTWFLMPEQKTSRLLRAAVLFRWVRILFVYYGSIKRER